MKKRKFLIFGSNGLLGSRIVNYLNQKNFSYMTSARSNSNFDLDVTNLKLVKRIFIDNKFDIVINCTAIIDIDYCEKNYSYAKKVNSNFVKELAKLSKIYHFKLVQISSDHVYKGNKGSLNKETDRTFAVNNYAKSKILAEEHCKNLHNYLVIRTNFTGKKNNSFLDELIKSINNSKKVLLFDDMFASTMDVNTCAKIVVKLAIIKSKGIYNLGTKDMISKKEFAINISKLKRKKLIYETVSSKVLQVPRGQNLGLDVRKIEKKLKKQMISSKQSIKKILRFYI